MPAAPPAGSVAVLRAYCRQDLSSSRGLSWRCSQLGGSKLGIDGQIERQQRARCDRAGVCGPNKRVHLLHSSATTHSWKQRRALQATGGRATRNEPGATSASGNR